MSLISPLSFSCRVLRTGKTHSRIWWTPPPRTSSSLDFHPKPPQPSVFYWVIATPHTSHDPHRTFSHNAPSEQWHVLPQQSPKTSLFEVGTAILMAEKRFCLLLSFSCAYILRVLVRDKTGGEGAASKGCRSNRDPQRGQMSTMEDLEAYWGWAV